MACRAAFLRLWSEECEWDISQIKNKLSKNNKKHLKNDMLCGMLLPYRKED